MYLIVENFNHFIFIVRAKEMPVKKDSITKRSEHVLQWSKANFFTFFLTSLLASFFNATRPKLVTLDFCIYPKIK